MKSVSEQLKARGMIETRNRLANARNNRPRHIQRRDLSSGWTLSKAARKELRDKADRFARRARLQAQKDPR